MIKLSEDCAPVGRNAVYSFFAENPYSVTIKVSVVKEENRSIDTISYLNIDGVNAASKISPTPMNKGYPVDPDTVPKSICWESKRRVLPDIITSHNAKIVSEKIREIIEDLEGDAHQFIPVDVFRPNESLPFAKRYWMIVCRRIDSVFGAETTVNRSPSGLWCVSGEGKLVFSLAAIGSANLWHDPDIIRSILCSHRLANAFKSVPLVGLSLSAVKAI